MRYSEIIAESLTFKDEMRGSDSGQLDLRLNAYDANEYVGCIDYSVYQGEPHIQMISVPEKRRLGYATALLQELQRHYPGTEIAWGMMTSDGAKLYQAVPKTIVQNKNVQDKMALLKQHEAKVTKFETLANGMDTALPPHIIERWNSLNDQIWNLEKEFSDASPTTTLIATD